MVDIFMGAMVIVLTVFILVATIIMIMGIYRLFKAIRSDSKKCKWSNSGDLFSCYETGCGESFHNADESGEPVTLWANYCPYCAGRILHDNSGENA